MSERLKQGERARSVWHDVVLSWQLLRFWHEDNDLYHWTGCLISKAVSTAAPSPVCNTCLPWRGKTESRSSAKSCWKKYGRSCSAATPCPICTRCATTVITTSFDGCSFSSTSNSRAKRARRFPFGEHRRQSWSLEHIQAQNVESLTNVRDQTNWVRDHLDELRQMSPDALTKEEKHMSDDEFQEKKSALAASCSAFLKKDDEKKNMEDFDALYNAVMQFLRRVSGDSDERTHTLGNLALLDGGSNSRLNNAIFAVKRDKAAQHDAAGNLCASRHRRRVPARLHAGTFRLSLLDRPGHGRL